MNDFDILDCNDFVSYNAYLKFFTGKADIFYLSKVLLTFEQNKFEFINYFIYFIKSIFKHDLFVF